MSDFNDLLQDAIAARQDECPDEDGNPLQCIWNKLTIPVVAGTNKQGKELGLGGWGIIFDLVLIISMEDLENAQQSESPIFPLPKQTVTYPPTAGAGVLYRIEEVSYPPGSAFMALGLVQPTKGS